MSHVLVTGGAGYIGSHVIQELLDNGFPVVTIDNLSTGNRLHVPERAAFVHGDCGSPALLDGVFNRYDIDAVMHFAGSIVVSDSVRYPLVYYANNTGNSLTLAYKAIHTGVRAFVFSSSAAVYGAPEASPIGEDSPTLPINPYGASKLMTEWMLRDAGAAHALPYIGLRYFNVAGADPLYRRGEAPPTSTHLIKILCEVMVGAREKMVVFGDDYPTPDGTCIRDYIHVSDLARAHVAALRHLLAGKPGGFFNCGYGRGYSIKEILDAARDVSATDFLIEISRRRPGDPPRLVADITKMRATLDWQPQFDNVHEIIRHAYRWEQSIA